MPKIARICRLASILAALLAADASAQSKTRAFVYDAHSLPAAIVRGDSVIRADTDFDENGNLAEPWNLPFGFEKSLDDIGVDKTNRIILPAGKRIVVKGYRWAYPVGTEVQEIFRRHGHVFETRHRFREADRWTVDVKRRVADREDYVAQVGVGWSSEYQEHEITDDENTIRVVGATDKLPPIPAATFERLMRRPLVSVSGRAWYKNAFGPSTDAEKHIIPPHYIGGAFEVDSDNCRQCHQDVANRFSIRGDDGIFSWHPYKLGSSASEPYDVRWFRDGFAVGYNPETHSVDDYPNLKEILK